MASSQFTIKFPSYNFAYQLKASFISPYTVCAAFFIFFLNHIRYKRYQSAEVMCLFGKMPTKYLILMKKHVLKIRKVILYFSCTCCSAIHILFIDFPSSSLALPSFVLEVSCSTSLEKGPGRTNS